MLFKMKQRRTFLKTMTLGLFSSLLVFISKLSFGGSQKVIGVIRHQNDGETFLIRPNAPVTIMISKTRDNVDSISFGKEEISPSDRIPVHKHQNEDEIVFIQNGRGTFTLGDEKVSVETGSTVFVPKGVWHGLENIGPDVMVMIFGFNPSGFEGYFREIGSMRGQEFKQKTKDEYLAAATKYGIEYKRN